MKKRLLLLTILALVLGACIVLSSCDKSNTDNSQNVTVTFDTKGGSAIESVQVTKGEKVAKPQDPQKEGYTLEGWYVDDEKWSFDSNTVTDSMTLVAKWVPTTYTITYVGDVTNTSKATYTIEDESFDLTGTGKTHYEFLGWYEDEEFTKQVTKIEKGTVGNKTLYAKTEYVPVVLELDGDSYKVVGYDKITANVVIPSTYNGKNVTSIGEEAFYDCTSLTSIEIPNSVTSIGDGAFYRCTSLTSVTIGDSVTSIGEIAFRGCTSLTIYCEAQSKPSGWDTNWNYSNCPVVWNCNNNDVANDGYIYTVIDGIRYGIKDGKATVARQPRSIKEAIIKESITYKNVSYPVTSIGDDAFADCESLTSVTIPNSVTSIGEEAFYDCTSLTSITIPNSVTSIGEEAFRYCTSLTSITIGDSVTSIGDGAFASCDSLTSIEIPNSVTSIGEEAFYRCASLTSVTIGDSVTSIGRYAFNFCESLTSVTIPNSVTSIGDEAFSGCESLTSVSIPNSVTSIGDGAFYNCTSLTSIEIPNSVTSIDSWTFYGCTSLTSVSIGDSVTSIGSYAFLGCTSLVSIMVDENNKAYKSIEGNLYTYDEKTLVQYAIGKTDKEFAIPNSVTSIGEYAFSGCTSLTSVTIGDSVTSIGKYAFSSCTSLTIYCEATSKPSGWDTNWNYSNCPVVWGYKQGE